MIYFNKYNNQAKLVVNLKDRMRRISDLETNWINLIENECMQNASN